MELLKRVINELPECRVEAILNETSTETIDFESGKVNNTNSGSTVKLEVRVSKGLRSAYAWTNNLNDWRDCVLRAKKLMQASSELKVEAPLSKTKVNDKSFIDSSINEVTLDLMKEKGLITSDAIKGAGALPNSVGLTKVINTESFMNSGLISCVQKRSALSISAECSIKDVSCFDSTSSQGLKIDFSSFGGKIGKLCKESVKPKKLTPGLYDVVLDYAAFQGVLEILTPSLLANNIIEHNSLLEGKEGALVVSDLLTIKDMSALPDSISNGVIDEEGVPVTDKDVFNKGVLKNYFNDLYTAIRMGKTPTGNSGGLLKRGLVTPHNLLIVPGKVSKQEMLSDCVYINNVLGVHTANTVSGDFALNALNAFKYDSVGNKIPLRDVMISGNVFELLKNVKALGKEVRSEDSLSTPLIKFSKTQLIG